MSEIQKMQIRHNIWDTQIISLYYLDVCSPLCPQICKLDTIYETPRSHVCTQDWISTNRKIGHNIWDTQITHLYTSLDVHKNANWTQYTGHPDHICTRVWMSVGLYNQQNKKWTQYMRHPDHIYPLVWMYVVLYVHKYTNGHNI